MVVVKVLGGLGNQMFQYAAGSALATKNNTQLKVDITGFDSYRLRNFDLNRFDFNINVASNEDIKRLKAQTFLQRGYQRVVSYSIRSFYKEPFFHYDEKFFQLNEDVYIQGYFQSEKYFIQVQDQIRNQFLLNEQSSLHVEQFSAHLKNHNSVALHLRRGDYNDLKTMDVHKVLAGSYYRKAIEFINLRVPNAKFYLFSDDVKNALKEFTSAQVEVVSGKVSHDHFEDMFLMSNCRHNIIANSSFSWWAAWLNQNTDKIVIAPKQWFNNGPKDTQDLLPASWIKL